jgi:XisI protein
MGQALTPDQTAILRVLEPIRAWTTPYANVRYEVITDLEHQHFQVVATGWDETKRIHTTLVHLVIRNNLIWLEEDRTDAEIAEQLMREGIPKERIVLGFQAPYKRPYTGFATGE